MNKLISIAGSSGVGKSTLSKMMSFLLDKNNTQISGDDLHRWNRKHPSWKIFTHLNPDANDLSLGLSHLKSLKRGEIILRKAYSHDTGDFLPEIEIQPKEWIIYEGLHALYGEAAQLANIRIFVETSEELKIEWKVKRDTGERGYNRQQVMDAIHARKHDEKAFIEPQKNQANIIVRFEKIGNKVVMTYTCLDREYDQLMTNVKKIYDSLEEFAGLCKKLSLEPDLVQGRGGNVSVKMKDSIIVTSSGYAMSSVTINSGFCVCNSSSPIDTSCEDNFLFSLKGSKMSGDSSPSMELALHRKSSGKVTAHTHPVHLNTILCCEESQEILQKIFSNMRFGYVKYVSPGLQLYENFDANENVIFLENHGLIVSGDNEDEVFSLTQEIDKKCKLWIQNSCDIFTGFLEKSENKYLFPDAVIFQEEMSFTQDFMTTTIHSLGLTPRFLTSLEIDFLRNMRAEKERKIESHRTHGRNGR